MRVLVTGSNGQLGRSITWVLKHHEVLAKNRQELDITDPYSIFTVAKDFKPEIVINCAAFTDIEECETKRDEAYRVNIVGTRNLAIETIKYNATYVHISTDYIFDGKVKTPYKEDHQANPINVYGESKLGGELLVKNICSKYFIIRTSRLYSQWGNNFVKAVIEKSRHQSSLEVVKDQVSSPTYALDLARSMSLMLNTNKYGIYHITNSGCCSWYDMAKKVIEITGQNVKVEPINSNAFNNPARRPAYSVLDNSKFIRTFNHTMPHWEKSLRNFIRNSYR